MNKWPPELCEQVTALWEQGLSAGMIASVLGPDFTRSSIIGKLHRLGIKGGENHPTTQAMSAAKKLYPHRHGRIPRSEKRAQFREIIPVNEPEFLGPLNDFPDAKSCRYPRGQMEKDFQCCGQPGFPWCEFHHARVYTHSTYNPEKIKGDGVPWHQKQRRSA